MFTVGQQVIGPHGPGHIVEVRQPRPNPAHEYLMSSRGMAALSTIPHCLATTLVEGAYNPERYPYRVQFESGYCDVYGEGELQPA